LKKQVYFFERKHYYICMTKSTKITIIIVFSLALIIGGYLLTKNVGKESTVVGADADEHGCIGSAGYSWCEGKQKCLRVWEEPCE
jgi:hypothetical protein